MAVPVAAGLRLDLQGGVLDLELLIQHLRQRAAHSVGIGLSISAVAKNMQQVMVYCFVFMLPMILLSGLATPIHNMPDVLQYVTYINPMRFTIEAIRRIYLEGAGLALIAYNYIPMLVVASITLPLASWLFRHKLS